MTRLTKIEPTEKSRWPFNLRVYGGTGDEMRDWLVESHGHGDCYNDEATQTWFHSRTSIPHKKDVDIVYFLWGPGFIQFKHEEDMVAFILRFSG